MESGKEPGGLGLLVSDDLIFSTKITGTARALGLDVQVVALPDQAAGGIAVERPRCVILDLGTAGLTVERIRAIVESAGDAPVLAYGSHVDTARLEEARTAGCSDVMPRSRMAAELPRLLQRYLAG